jgi:hypothetical protein
MTKRPYPFSTPVYIGIDPQQKFLSVNIATHDGQTIAWFNHILKRKQSSQFATAQAWQEYICRECMLVLERVVHDKARLGGFQHITITKVGIEQQKGRVNTILEQALLDVCIFLKLPVHILHPTTWKNKTKIPCMGNNKDNKEVCVKLTRDKMNDFFGEETVKEMEKAERIHDYCDCYRIREATQIMHNSKGQGKEIKWEKTSLPLNTQEKKLATSTPTQQSTETAMHVHRPSPCLQMPTPSQKD